MRGTNLIQKNKKDFLSGLVIFNSKMMDGVCEPRSVRGKQRLVDFLGTNLVSYNGVN